jgi:hypothetical protein
VEEVTVPVRLALPADLPYVVALQNLNRESVGHLPTPALAERVDRGTVALSEENGEPCGYLLYDYTAGVLRIPQACIQYDARRQTFGHALVAWVTGRYPELAEMRLRCAADLEANLFWQGLGFHCVAVVAGGSRRGRKINLWRRWYTPRLFGLADVGVIPAAQSRIDCMYDDTDYVLEQPAGFSPIEMLPKIAWSNRRRQDTTT